MSLRHKTPLHLPTGLRSFEADTLDCYFLKCPSLFNFTLHSLYHVLPREMSIRPAPPTVSLVTSVSSGAGTTFIVGCPLPHGVRTVLCSCRPSHVVRVTLYGRGAGCTTGLSLASSGVLTVPASSFLLLWHSVYCLVALRLHCRLVVCLDSSDALSYSALLSESVFFRLSEVRRQHSV